jgi:hypothetical protein
MDDSRNMSEGELGVLARRKIEAAIVAPIYDEMRQALGEEKARDMPAGPILGAHLHCGCDPISRASMTWPRALVSWTHSRVIGLK